MYKVYIEENSFCNYVQNVISFNAKTLVSLQGWALKWLSIRMSAQHLR